MKKPPRGGSVSGLFTMCGLYSELFFFGFFGALVLVLDEVVGQNLGATVGELSLEVLSHIDYPVDVINFALHGYYIIEIAVMKPIALLEKVNRARAGIESSENPVQFVVRYFSTFHESPLRIF